MAEETQYTSKNGIVIIDTANANLDGTGTLGTVITAGSNGTLLKTIWVKAQETTTDGMVRLFIDDGVNVRLLQEIKVEATTPSSITKSFEAKLNLNYSLKSGYILKASTENSETFSVVVEAMDWAYYADGVRTDTTKYTAVSGLTSIDTANTSLDGTGTTGLAFTNISANGNCIKSICIKSIVNTTQGMIRLFIQDDNVLMPTIALFTEIQVPANTKSSKAPAIEHTITFDSGHFELQDNYSIYASTEKSETFKLFTVGLARAYAP